MFVLEIAPYLFKVIVAKVFSFYERGKDGLDRETQGMITKDLHSQNQPHHPE